MRPYLTGRSNKCTKWPPTFLKQVLTLFQRSVALESMMPSFVIYALAQTMQPVCSATVCDFASYTRLLIFPHKQ